MALIKEEHFGIARKIVSNMTTESWREIPHAIVMYEADVTDILSNGNVTWEKELPDIGTVQIANIRGIKYMKIISTIEGETLTTYVFY